MLTSRLAQRTADSSSRNGFTLVELLVVLGIIAILISVSFGPIIAGIKRAQQSTGVQTCHTLCLAEFQYANDHSQAYPAGVADASEVAKLLLAGNYVSDPGIFYILGSEESKYTGTTPSTGIQARNISYDFVIQEAGTGLNSTTPDQIPVVMSSCGPQILFSPLGGSISTTLNTLSPFGVAGIAIGYHNNSAKFAPSNSVFTVALTDPDCPGARAVTLPGGG